MNSLFSNQCPSSKLATNYVSLILLKFLELALKYSASELEVRHCEMDQTLAVFWTRFWFSLNFNETLQAHGIGTVLPWVIELVVYIYDLGDRGVFFLQVVLVGHSLGSISLLHAMENFTHKISLAIHVAGALLPSGVSFETTGDYFKGVRISPNSDSLTTYDPCQVL
jgi:hypothetical protein